MTNLDLIKEYKKKITLMRQKSILNSPLKKDKRQNSNLFNVYQTEDQIQSKDQSQIQISLGSSNFMNNNKKNNFLLSHTFSSKNVLKGNKMPLEIQNQDQIQELNHQNVEKKQQASQTSQTRIIDFNLQSDSIKENSLLDDSEISQKSNVFRDQINEIEKGSKEYTLEGINRTLNRKQPQIN